MIRFLLMKRTLGWMVVPIILFTLSSCQEQEEPQEAFQLLEATLPQIEGALASGTITSQDLVEMYLARIAAYDQQGPSLNAIITVNPNALAEAKALDAERAANGPRGPLHGIPVIVKDNYETKDMQTTAGSLSLAGWIPPHDAFLVKRLREGGAIILAKATLHEFAMGIITVGSLFGQTRNPYALDRNPGGSSGGTGAAVAANFAAVGLGDRYLQLDSYPVRTQQPGRPERNAGFGKPNRNHSSLSYPGHRRTDGSKRHRCGYRVGRDRGLRSGRPSDSRECGKHSRELYGLSSGWKDWVAPGSACCRPFSLPWRTTRGLPKSCEGQ